MRALPRCCNRLSRAQAESTGDAGSTEAKPELVRVKSPFLTNNNVKDFERVLEASRLMSGFYEEWFVVGGWAIDLFVGERTREHDDVDLGLAREHQVAARRLLAGWRYEKVVPRELGLVREPWSEDEWLDLPVHEIHVRSPAGRHVEFLLLERLGDEWVYRRDPRVTLPWRRLSFESPLGFRVLAPEVALLFKAKGQRDRDQADFATVLPRLQLERRAWLRAALEVSHPGHRWLDDL